MKIKIENWGQIPYPLGHQRQKQYVQDIATGVRGETVVLCCHPPVVTLGKKSTPNDIIGWQGEVHSVERGGKATYHGPGQVICYPMIDLKLRGQGLGQFLNAMETSIVKALAHYGVNATGNTDRGNPQLTGVWAASGKKLASIGVAIKNWITYHGLAVNLYHDPLAFQGINPCGYGAGVMDSLEATIQQKVNRHDFENQLLHSLMPLLPPHKQVKPVATATTIAAK